MDDISIAFGKRIMGLRQSAGLTQEQLAEKSGIDVSKIKKLEAGEISFGRIKIYDGMEIAAALDATVEDIVEGLI